MGKHSRKAECIAAKRFSAFGGRPIEAKLLNRLHPSVATMEVVYTELFSDPAPGKRVVRPLYRLIQFLQRAVYGWCALRQMGKWCAGPDILIWLLIRRIMRVN
jgi:hypothetical protein